MHFLPAVRLASGEIRLPLCDHSAGQLAQCWLTAAAARPPHCLALLRAEPVLAVWAFAQLYPFRTPAPELLDWPQLATCLGSAPVPFSSEDGTPPRDEVPAVHATSAQRTHWAKLSQAQFRELHAASENDLPRLLAESARQWTHAIPAASQEPSIDRPFSSAEATTSTNEPPIALSPGHLTADPSDIVAQHWLSSTLDEQRWLVPLASKLARLAQLEDNLEQAVRDDKLRALKEFAYGASHEINNPLANISTRAQSLLREERDPERRRKLATINSQAFRAHEMISDLMLFAHPPPLEYQSINLTEIVTATIAELRAQAVHQQIVLEQLGGETAHRVMADPRHIAVAIKALLQNALEAVASEGRVTIRLRPATWSSPAGPRSGIEVCVSDTGPGVPDALRSRIFDPYYSGREAGRGLGLGLSKSWRIATLHGGQLELADAPTGATFVLRLPNEPR